MDHVRVLELMVSRLLRTGVVVSGFLMVVGLGLLLATGDVSCPSGVLSVDWVLFGDPFLEPSHVLFLGFFILIGTPLLRIVASATAHLVERDFVFALLNITVLLILVVSFVLGVG
ncbi:DUF1634 domain-containing protein [Candidatus Bathyarchaeota archaeon]|nr:DUF1634 domain-containing protein [Candidatus Bathyarchaeota archaeon]